MLRAPGSLATPVTHRPAVHTESYIPYIPKVPRALGANFRVPRMDSDV